MGVYRIVWRRAAQLRRAWVGSALVPVNTAAPVASGTPEVGETLSCTTGTWTLSPTSYTYQWQRDNSGGGTYSDIAAATSSTYVLVSADADSNVRCQVTAHNTVGASRPAASNALPVTVAYASLGDSLPRVLVEIDFANNPTSSTRTWTSVTAYVREFAVERGREDALSRPQVGKLTLTLQNTDGRFDPTNTAGPYYPNVLPMRRIRVRCKWNNVVYNLFYGFIEDWPLSFPDLGKNALVEVQAVDGLAVLGQFDLSGKSYAGQRSDLRVSAVLVDCGFGTAEMNLQAGQSSVVASGTLSSTTAQSHLLDVAASESGLLFYDTGGTWQFHDRTYRQLQKAIPVGTVGTDATMIGYQDFATSYGVGDVWNIVTVTANGGTAETAADAASTASYYQRSLAWPVGGDYLVSSQVEALAAAQYVLGLYAQPALRVPQVLTVPAGETTNWPTVLALELSDRLSVRHRRPDGGTIASDKYAEGISHRVSVERTWEAGLNLSDTSAQASWLLGDAELSLLGETTNLSF